MKPLTTTIILAFIVFASSCDTPMDDLKRSEKETIEWIETHKKPISVGYSTAFDGTRRYTLIDSDGKIFISDYTMLALPDPIGQSVKP